VNNNLPFSEDGAVNFYEWGFNKFGKGCVVVADHDKAPSQYGYIELSALKVIQNRSSAYVPDEVIEFVENGRLDSEIGVLYSSVPDFYDFYVIE
jgi:hypothetical protein